MKLAGLAAFLMVLGIAGAVERGGDLRLLLLSIPALAVMAAIVVLIFNKNTKER